MTPTLEYPDFYQPYWLSLSLVLGEKMEKTIITATTRL